MSDPYPEVREDESGIVPPQPGRNPDWPKKIRTLTAAELDRLTIDSSGRFYWDGKLVNYEPPQHKPAERAETSHVDPLDPAAFDVLDRAAYELKNGKAAQPPDATPSNTDDASNESARSQTGDVSAIELDAHREVAPQMVADERPAAHTPIIAPPLFGAPDRVRVKLSAWQSLGLFIAVLSIVAGGAGLAASGLIAVHDWGCRAGMVRSYCAQAPAARPTPVRPDIPA
jgi:hypothetical protein